MFELMETAQQQNAVIKVVGIGGGGGNAVQHMMDGDIFGVEFIVANTDAQALRHSSANTIIQLGDGITRGLGAGANPEIGRRAAEEDREKIHAALAGADMVFIACGEGGGTGTGAAPVFAEIAKEIGALTVAVTTKPFSFEGKMRAQVAEAGIASLSQYVDSLITIPNNKLLTVLGKNVTLVNAFRAANDVLRGAVQGISELITRPGLINVDFADVRTVMSEMGMAMMGTGVGSGDNRARLAAEAAIASPLLEDVDLTGAKGVLVNITAGLDLSIGEFEEVGEVVKNITLDSAKVVIGTVIDPELRDEVRVTVIVTGLGRKQGARVSTDKPAFESILGTSVNAPTLISSAMHKPDLAAASAHSDFTAYDKQPAISRRESAQSASASLSTTSTAQSVAPSTFVAAASITTLTSRTVPNASLGTGHSFAVNQDALSDIDYLDIPAFLRKKEEKEEL